MKKPNLNRFRSRRDPECSVVDLKRSVTTTEETTTKKHTGLPGRLRALPLSVVLPLALVATATIMYMVATAEAVTNTFSFGTAEVTIIEDIDDSQSVPLGEENKPVYLQNTGEVSGVVRAMFVPVLIDSDNNVLSGNLGDVTAEPSGTTLVLGDITLHLVDNWQTYWFYKDGYFYYKYVLDPGDTTEQLLAGVTLTDGSFTDISLTDDSITATVEVLADIIQIEGSALDEWGLTISEGVVTTKTT